MWHVKDYIPSPIEYCLNDESWFSFIQNILNRIVFSFLKEIVSHCFKFSKKLNYAFVYLALRNFMFPLAVKQQTCLYDLNPIRLFLV